MNKLFQLLVRYQNFILFVFLQIIALFWLFQTNKFHGAAYFNASQILAAHTSNLTSKITDYIDLKAKNEDLAARITELENEKKNSFQAIYDSTNFRVSDSLQYKRKWKFYPAKIINKSVRLIDNNMTIDRGKQGGIHRDLGVVNGNNVVGVVKKVSNEYALVIPLINTQLNLGAKLKKTNHIGILEWTKKDVSVCQLSNIPAFIQVDIGDTVVTSGFSSYFPEGMLIGSISKILTNEASNSTKLEVKLFTDFTSISHVEVVENLLHDEQKKLEKEID